MKCDSYSLPSPILGDYFIRIGGLYLSKITSVIEQRIIELVKERKQLHNIDKSINMYPWVAVTIANEFGLHLDSEKIRKLCRKYREKNGLNENFEKISKSENAEFNKTHQDLNDKDAGYGYKETTEIHADGKQTSDKLLKMSAEESKDVEFLLRSHGYDIKVWELVSARNNIWNVYSKQDGIQVLYSSKIVVKPRIDNISLTEMKEHFAKFSQEYQPTYTQPIKIYNSGKMLEIDFADVHFAKLCHHAETGNNYDYKIASKRFMDMVNDIYNRVKHMQFEKIIYVFGNDFFNTTTIDNTTVHGTNQDNDLRWSKMFLKGCELLIQGIDTIGQLAPVEVIYVPGNHDFTVSFYALNYLSAWYRNNPNIKVDVNPITRKYIQFGSVVIGYAHGDTEKKRINTLMQIEVPELWGKCRWREFHLHHLHHEKTVEENGLILRYLPSIVATDLWHYQSGYVGNIAKTQSFIWDKEKGLESILNSVII